MPHDSYFIPFIASFAACLLITPVISRLALAAGLIDQPSRQRFHLTSMPLLGGVAVAASFIAAILYFSGGAPGARTAGVIAAASFLMLLGLLDDIKTVSPLLKLAGQAVAATILIAVGLRVSVSGVAPVDYALTYLWVIGIVNCQNLLDNIDGLSVGAAAVASCFFFIAASFAGDGAAALAAAAFCGACLGFLFHNFHPASVFAGDAGSMFSGAILAALGLMMMKPGDVVSHSAAGVILGLLIFDTGLVTVYRLANGFRITDGGSDHTSHRLCNLGLGVQTAVGLLFAVCAMLGAAGILMLKVRRDFAMLVPLFYVFAALTGWFLMKNLYDYSNHPRE